MSRALANSADDPGLFVPIVFRSTSSKTGHGSRSWQDRSLRDDRRGSMAAYSNLSENAVKCTTNCTTKFQIMPDNYLI